MLTEKFNLEIISPHGVFLNGMFSYVGLPLSEGYAGITSMHRPIIASIKPGLLKTKTDMDIGSKNFINMIFVDKGFINFSDNRCVVLVEEAISVDNMKEHKIDSYITTLKAQIKEERIKEKAAKIREDLVIAQAKKSIIQDLSKM